MTEIYGGKMAFPIHNTGHGAPFDEGMTLRDYFAANAMTGLLTAEIVGEYSNEHVAEIAFRIADAMMKHRDSGE